MARIIRRYAYSVKRLPNREWMRAEEAAEYLQVTKQTICRYIKLRILIGRQPKTRGAIFVLTDSIRKALERSGV